MDGKAIAFLAMFAKKHGLNCLCVTAENGKLQKRLNKLEEKAREAGASAGKLQAGVMFVTEERAGLAAKRNELTLKMQFMLGLAEEAKSATRCG